MNRLSAQSAATATTTTPWTKEARLVFLVGCPRSGTTWLQNMLAMHPAVATGPETHFFSKASRFDGARLEEHPPRPAGILQYMSTEEFYEAFANFFHGIISKVPEPAGNPAIFLEKSPQHALFLPIIAKCLPNCRIIHLIRDGRHVVASLLRASRTWGKGMFPAEASTAAELWKRSVLAARQSPQLFGREDSYYEIRYEDIRCAPAASLRFLFDWLELTIDDEEIEKIVSANSLVETKSKQGFDAITVPASEQGHAASEPRGFFGKASVGKSFDLTRLEEYACYQICGELLQATGYCDSLPTVPWWARSANSWRVRRVLKSLKLGI